MDHPFLDACGASGPLMIRAEAPGTTGTETRAFDLPFVLIGRDPRTDLRLNHPEISDRHAYLQLVGGHLVCVDLGSRVGITQGGVRRKIGYVERDQAVRIGPYRVRLLGGDADPDATLGTPENGPPVTLELSHRSVRRSRCELAGGLALIGSAADCQVRLVDPSVSPYHASLLQTPQGLWVVDLLAEGGIRVNGREVGYARLDEGDTLQVGRSLVRIAGAAAPLVEPGAANCRRVAARSEVVAVAAIAPTRAAVAISERVGAESAGPPIRRMVEEIEQARALMFDSFAALQREHSERFEDLQREHSARLEEELEQVRQLGRELRELRDDLRGDACVVARPARSEADDDPVIAPQPTRLGTATASTSRALVLRAEVEVPDPSGPHSARLHDGRAPYARGKSHVEPDARIVPQHEEQAHAALCSRMVRQNAKPPGPWERMLALFPGQLKGKITF